MNHRNIKLPTEEIDRLLMALSVYANNQEYDKGNTEKARSIRQTARGIALQVESGGANDGR